MKTNNTYKGKIYKDSLIENYPCHKKQRSKNKRMKRRIAKRRLDNEIFELYEVPKGYFGEMKQSLLEAVEMEYGKGKREEVEKELKIEPFNNKYLCQYPDDSVIPSETTKMLWEFSKDIAELTTGMRDATPEEREYINKCIKEISYPTGVCFWENWQLNQNNETGINEIDTYISEINSQDNFIAEINSLPTTNELIDAFNELGNVAWVAEDELIRARELLKENIMEKIKIKYFTDKIEKLTYIDGKSDWIDLRAAEDIELEAGEFKLIPLGVAMEIPAGYEAHIVPRSSTFKNYGVIQTNHCGVVDNSYCGDNDQWFMPVYALRKTSIKTNDRVCQFRIVENQPRIQFNEVEHLEGADRGGHGSTGKQ